MEDIFLIGNQNFKLISPKNKKPELPQFIAASKLTVGAARHNSTTESPFGQSAVSFNCLVGIQKNFKAFF